MNANTAATMVGGILAAGAAAEPVLNGVQGSLNSQDWMQLAFAVGTALFGWFSRFKGRGDEGSQG